MKHLDVSRRLSLFKVSDMIDLESSSLDAESDVPLGVGEGWCIADDKGPLRLINHSSLSSTISIHLSFNNDNINYECETPVKPHLTSVVVDIYNDYIVAQSYSYIPTIVASNHVRNCIAQRTEQYYIGVEGTFIKLFKHDNQTYISTRTRLYPIDSHKSRVINLIQLYRSCGGVDPNFLFKPDVSNSRYCYNFMIVHDTLLKCSKIRIGPKFIRRGFIVDMGCIDCSIGMEQSKIEEIYDDQLGDYVEFDKSDMLAYINGVTSNPIVSLTELSPSNALDFLTYGYDIFLPNSATVTNDTIYSKDKLNPKGEFILSAHNVGNGINPYSKLVRIYSSAYVLRRYIRGKVKDPYHRYLQLMECESEGSNLYEAVRLFIFRDYSIFPRNHINVIANLNDSTLTSLIYALPLAVVDIAVHYRHRYDNDVRKCVNYTYHSFSGTRRRDKSEDKNLKRTIRKVLLSIPKESLYDLIKRVNKQIVHI